MFRWWHLRYLVDSLVDGSHAIVTGFILLSLTDDSVLHVILFMITLCIYLVTVFGNFSTITLTRISSQLHHPMYFLLSHLAFTDICLSTSVIPNMLVNFPVERNPISYHGCGVQLGSTAVFGAAECFLLAIMAYDRFVAICNPLLYSTTMSTQVCIQFITVAYIGGCLNSCSFIISFYFLFFCGPNSANHFFCDFAPLVELCCSDSSIPAVVPSLAAGSIIVFTALVIVVSYIYILITILKLSSTEGYYKAFFTCTAHLTAVTLSFGTVTFIYVSPKSTFSSDQNMVASVFYNVVSPMLNPVIYSLRNNEMKVALKREVHGIFP